MSEWQPIETIPDTRPVLVRDTSGDVWDTMSPDLTGLYVTHWAPLPTMPVPDPMTVVAWHEGEPPRGTHWVMPAQGDTVVVYDRQTVSKGRWCPLAPLLDLIDKAEQ